MNMIAILVADLQRHLANEAQYAGMDANQRGLREQGQRLQAEIAYYITSQPDPVTTKAVARYFTVTDECIRKHAHELAAAGKIVKLAGYPTRWWRKEH